MNNYRDYILNENLFKISFLHFTGDTTASGTEKGLRTWVKRSNLVDSRTSVTDVKFGPKHLGLLLVTCSADGIIR